MSNTPNVRAIVGTSKTFDLDKEKLRVFTYGKSRGRDENTLVAELLGMPAGGDVEAYLKKKLSPDELENLKNILNSLIANR